MKRLILTITFLLCSYSVAAKDSVPAPEFSLPGIHETVELQDYRGKVIYLDFWASWCLPCKDSFPWMNKIQEKYSAQGLEVIAINVDRDRNDAKGFLSKVPAHFTIAFDQDGSTPRAYKVMGMPSAYIVDPQGNIVHSHIGFIRKNMEEYERQITNVLAGNGGVQ